MPTKKDIDKIPNTFHIFVSCAYEEFEEMRKVEIMVNLRFF